MIDAERKNALMERFEAAYYSVTPGQGPASPEFPAFVLAKLLMKKGVITDEEYLEAIASEAEEEAHLLAEQRQEQALDNLPKNFGAWG